MSCVRGLLLCALLACASLASAQGAASAGDSILEQPPSPLRCRQRAGVVVAGASPRDAGLDPRELRRLSLRSEMHAPVDLSRWPPEPENQVAIQPARLAGALAELCPPVVTSDQLSEFAEEIVRASEMFAVDPLLLGALVYHQSGCDPLRRSSWGTGLTMLNEGLIPASLREGALRYVARSGGGAPTQHSIPFQPPLQRGRDALQDFRNNLRVAAALLRMFADQHEELDALCHSVAHRHSVSHFIWGDRVRGTAPEDGVLTARRRLLAYYRGAQAERVPLTEGATTQVGPLLVGSPLDGAPRIVTSGLGAPRDSGHRAHAGVDLLSHVGEPIRAVAAGEVLRAGADLREGGLVDIRPARAALIPAEAFGARGLFVELQHEDGYRTIYAHLASYVVQPGQKVARGELLGYVGRTGIHESDPHLHFGLFHGTSVVDPLQAMRALLFAPALERNDSARN